MSIEHGPKGGVGGISDIREYATLDGNPIGDGEDARHSITLPPWFSRQGRTLFSVDSGFGTVKCRAVPGSDATWLKLIAGDDNADWALLLSAIVALPSDWKVETEAKVGSMTFVEGDDFPPIEDVRKSKHTAREFAQNLLPPSLVTQIVTGQRYAALPPIPYTNASPR